MHAYQARGVQFIRDTPNCALWLDLGLGKTVTALTAAADLIEGFEAERVLVIAPKRVAIHTWPTEIGQWAHLNHLTFEVLAGVSAKERDRLTRKATDIHVINRELVEWLVDFWKAKWPYDLVIIDESSSFKSHRSKRFKALRKILPFTHRLIQMTGTPTSNGLLDLWAQIFLLDRGDRLGRTFTKFRDNYFAGDYMGYTWTPKKGAPDEIKDAVADLCLTMRAKDYLTLPPYLSRIVEVDLPTKARSTYRALEKDFLAEFGDDDAIEALTAATLSNKLLQVANGAVYDEDRKVWPMHDAKIEALAELAETGENLLVAYNYQHDLSRIKAAFPDAVALADDPDAIDRWNASEIQMLLAHPASAGHGLNLQHGGANVVWFGLNWSLELYQQFNARLYRQGQTKPVRVHHIVAKDSVDETVMAALASKNVTQKTLLLALRDDVLLRRS